MVLGLRNNGRDSRHELNLVSGSLYHEGMAWQHRMKRHKSPQAKFW